MILDTITNDIIQRTLDEGGKVYAFNQTEKFEVVRAENGSITINSGTYVFDVGDKISFVYEPKFASAWCEEYSDLDGDGIIDLVDLDADGDGVIDPRIPFKPTILNTEILLAPDQPDNVSVEKSPNTVKLLKAREYGKPILIDGYYPLYLTEQEAIEASPLDEPFAHPHSMSEEHDGISYQYTYWMPHGVNQYHGNYGNCAPDAPDIINVTLVETYDFEYVDRIYDESLFGSIVPFDYGIKLLGLDTDENGIFEDQRTYSLDYILNINDVEDLDGNVVEAAPTAHAHYVTNPRQSWVFEITNKRASEDVLEDGHSFQIGNYVYDIRTFTKFDLNTSDSDQHTLSVLKYFSRLANGDKASMGAVRGGQIMYNEVYEQGDRWTGVVPLEINSNGYLVLDDDIFDVGTRIYLVEGYVPNAPTITDVSITVRPSSPFILEVIRLPDRPLTPSFVNASVMAYPDAPEIPIIEILKENQEIIWEQFETAPVIDGESTDEVEVIADLITKSDVNVLNTTSNQYSLKYSFGEMNFLKVSDSRAYFLQTYDWTSSTSSDTRDLLKPAEFTKDAYLSDTLVTKDFFMSIMPDIAAVPSNIAVESGSTDKYPLANITYGTCLEFIKRLNQVQKARGNLPQGWSYTLPSPILLNSLSGYDIPAIPQSNADYATIINLPLDKLSSEQLENNWRNSNIGSGAARTVKEASADSFGFFDLDGNLPIFVEPVGVSTSDVYDDFISDYINDDISYFARGGYNFRFAYDYKSFSPNHPFAHLFSYVNWDNYIPPGFNRPQDPYPPLGDATYYALWGNSMYTDVLEEVEQDGKLYRIVKGSDSTEPYAVTNTRDTELKTIGGKEMLVTGIQPNRYFNRALRNLTNKNNYIYEDDMEVPAGIRLQLTKIDSGYHNENSGSSDNHIFNYYS